MAFIESEYGFDDFCALVAKPSSRCVSRGSSKVHRLPNARAISSSMRYFSLGEIQFTDNQGNSLGTGRQEFAMN